MPRPASTPTSSDGRDDYYTPPPPPRTLSNGLYEPGRLDDYIIYDLYGCCNCFGGHGPINLEVYLRSGVSCQAPNDGIFYHRLGAAWVIEGGGRSLFFNPEGNRAWTIDLKLSNFHSSGGRDNLPVILYNADVPNPNFNSGQPLGELIPVFIDGNLEFVPNVPDFIANLPVTIRNLNRTYVGASIGQEFFFPMNGCWHWRCGYDIGGRWGTANLELNDPNLTSNFRRITDVIGAAFGAVHADVERACSFGIVYAGVRIEYNYNWMDLLPRLDNNLEEFNFLATVGVRF
jgi:hypothetical protein